MTDFKKIRSFLLIAFGLTWGIASIGYLVGIDAASGTAYMILAASAMLCPAAAAIIQQRVIDKEAWAGLGLRLKGTDWRIVAYTALAGLCIVPVCLAVLEALGDRGGFTGFGSVNMTTEGFINSVQEAMAAAGVEAAADQFAVLADLPATVILVMVLLQALLAACTVNLPFMLGEELGWRGYLFQRIAHWRGLQRVLFTGAIWGLWHAPLIMMGHNYPGYPIIGVFMMVVFCVLAAFLFDWTRSRSRSIWSSCVLHGIINGSAGAVILFASGGHVLIGSIVGVAGFIAILIISMAILILDKRYRNEFISPVPMVEVSVT